MSQLSELIKLEMIKVQHHHSLLNASTDAEEIFDTKENKNKHFKESEKKTFKQVQ